MNMSPSLIESGYATVNATDENQNSEAPALQNSLITSLHLSNM